MPPDTVRLFGEPLAMAAAGALFQVQDAVQLIGVGRKLRTRHWTKWGAAIRRGTDMPIREGGLHGAVTTRKLPVWRGAIRGHRHSEHLRPRSLLVLPEVERVGIPSRVDIHHMINVPAGTFDNDPGLQPQRHIFVNFKAVWFDITDGLPRFAAK